MTKPIYIVPDGIYAVVIDGSDVKRLSNGLVRIQIWQEMEINGRIERTVVFMGDTTPEKAYDGYSQKAALFATEVPALPPTPVPDGRKRH